MERGEPNELNLSLEKLSETIDDISIVLELISENSLLQPAISVVDGEPIILSSASTLSAIGTLDSIRICASKGHFGDAFALARKVRDDLYQFLFLRDTLQTEIENLPVGSYATWEEVQSLDEEKFTEIVKQAWEAFIFGERSKPYSAATTWLNNELDGDEASHMRKSYFDASKYIILLRQNLDVDNCYKLFFEDRCLSQDRVFNNYVHSNGKLYLSSNLNSTNQEKQRAMCETLNENISLTAIVFLSIFILISPALVASDDYISALELGDTPIEGSQYWVDSRIKTFITDYFPLVSTELKSYLHRQNKYNMQIE
jgi:hypothetical protein